MTVVLADIDGANLTRTEASLKTQGGTVLGVRTDVSKANPLVKVSVLRPGPVRTNIANAEPNRPPRSCVTNHLTMIPETQAGPAAFKATLEASMPPGQVGDVVFDAVKKEQFYIFPIPNGQKRSNSERTNCSEWKIRKALWQRL